MAKRAPRKRTTTTITDHAPEAHTDALDALVHEAHIDPAEAHMAEAPPSQYGRFDPRKITAPAPLFPLLVLFGLNAVDELDRVAFGVLIPEIRDWFGLSLTALGIITVIITPMSLLLELPIAYYADRRNRVRMAVAGATIWAAFSVMTGLAWNLLILVIARLGASLGRLFNATHNSLLSDYYPSSSRVKVFYAHSLANRVGQILAPLAAGALATFFVWRTPFVLFAIPTMIFVFLGLRLREPKRGVHERIEAGSDAKTAEIEDDPPGFAETFRILFQSRTAKRIYYALPFWTVSFFGLATFTSVFFADEYNLGPFTRGVLFSASDVVGVIALFFGGRIVQRMVIRSPAFAMKLLGVSAVGVSGGIVIMAVSPNLPIAVSGYLFSAFMGAMLLPGALAVISFVIPPHMRTLGFATGNLWLLLGAPLIPIVGAVGDAAGVRFGLLMSVPTYLLGAFLFSSAGWTIEHDIERVRLSARAQAEMFKSRQEGTGKLLICRDLDVAYDGVQVLFKVDFDVADGEIVALLGTNGAGKSTLLKAISGLMPSTGGTALFDGRVITNADPVQVARLGIAQIPGGRAVFPTLTVEENIRIAGWMHRDDSEHVKEATERILDHFPVLRDRWEQKAGDLSGGEQQMLSLAQAFLSRPKLLLIDELTLGLAPTIVEKLLAIVRTIHDQGTTIVLVEQSVNIALKLAKRAVFLEKGEVRFSGPTEELLERPDVLRAVFLKGASAVSGDGATQRTSARAADTSPRRNITGDVVLRSEGVTKHYGGIMAVDAVDLELRQDEILGIIGPNGAGKTTFFDLLTGFTPMDGGRVELRVPRKVHGGEHTDELVDVSSWPANARTRAGLGRSFQDARLWSSLTVSEVIAVAFERTISERGPVHAMFGLPVVGEAERNVRRRAEELIELLGLGAFRDKFVAELSTGSRRIVEIATILAHRPSVLLLDEPSSGIAQRETEALGPLLRRVREYMDGSLIVVEHNVPLISDLADRIIAMDLGSVIADGPPDKVLRDRKVVEAYLGTSAYTEIVGDIEKKTPRAKRSGTKSPAAKR
jgi:ABC-type branched-subunit amino acid transport system ATPase component/predicted MFS family arabinose efflux permease